MAMLPAQKPLTIANGVAVSANLNLGELTALALITPGALTNTAFTFEVSHDGVTFFPLYKDDGTQYTATVATAEAHGIPLDYTLFLAWRWVRLKGTGNEGAARTLALIVSPMP